MLEGQYTCFIDFPHPLAPPWFYSYHDATVPAFSPNNFSIFHNRQYAESALVRQLYQTGSHGDVFYSMCRLIVMTTMKIMFFLLCSEKQLATGDFLNCQLPTPSNILLLKSLYLIPHHIQQSSSLINTLFNSKLRILNMFYPFN